MYIKSFSLLSDEYGFLKNYEKSKMTCYRSVYPFGVFSEKELSEIEFSPVTFFYGGNGSGKTTLLNIIASKLGAKRAAIYDLDSQPAGKKPWTKLENVRTWFEFFDSVRDEVFAVRRRRAMTDKEMLFEENFTCLLAAGTSEGLEVMRVLDKLHIKTAACVATELGAKMLRETGACVFVGRMDKAGFEKFISAHKVHFVIDATHPFAVEVTKNLKGAAEACGVSYARYIRKTQAYHYEKIIHAADAREAAVRLLEMPGNILLTTGANTAPIYKEILPDFN